MNAPSASLNVSSLRPQTPAARRDLCAIEDVDPAGATGLHLNLILEPAVGEVHRVVRRGHGRVLGVRPVLELVGRLVIAREQVERVVHVLLPGAGAQTAAAPEQVDPAVPGLAAQRAADAHLHAAAGDHAVGRRRTAGRLEAGVPRHQGNLVIGIHVGVGVRPDPRAWVRVDRGDVAGVGRRCRPARGRSPCARRPARAPAASRRSIGRPPRRPRAPTTGPARLHP